MQNRVIIILVLAVLFLSGCNFADNYAGDASRRVDFASASCKSVGSSADSSFNGVKNSFCNSKTELMQAFCDGRSSSFKTVDCSLTKQVCSGGLCVNPSDIGVGPGGQGQVRDVVKVTSHVYGLSGSHVADVAGNSVTYHVQDRIGSTRLSLDSSEDIVGKFTSLPFGEPVINDDVRYAFATGKELDESGLYNFGARYYDSNLGRFITVDPVQDNHAYSYVKNNPLKLVDPTGMDDESSLDAHELKNPYAAGISEDNMIIMTSGTYTLETFMEYDAQMDLESLGASTPDNVQIMDYTGEYGDLLSEAYSGLLTLRNEMRAEGASEDDINHVLLCSIAKYPYDNFIYDDSRFSKDSATNNYGKPFEQGPAKLGEMLSCGEGVCVQFAQFSADLMRMMFPEYTIALAEIGSNAGGVDNHHMVIYQIPGESIPRMLDGNFGGSVGGRLAEDWKGHSDWITIHVP